MQEQQVNPAIPEAEDLLRRIRESEEAERMWKRQWALIKAGRPLSKEEKEEVRSIDRKLNERDKFFRYEFDQPLIYEEFTEVYSGIPRFDDFLVTTIFKPSEGKGKARQNYLYSSAELTRPYAC